MDERAASRIRTDDRAFTLEERVRAMRSVPDPAETLLDILEVLERVEARMSKRTWRSRILPRRRDLSPREQRALPPGA